MSFDSEILVNHTLRALGLAATGTSGISEGALAIAATESSVKVKHFLHALCSLQGARYLEVGLYRGASFCSAVGGNEDALAAAVGIDNWSQFGGPREVFKNNLRKHVGGAAVASGRVRVIDQDSWTVKPARLRQLAGGSFDIYYYDGDHSEEGQRKAFAHLGGALSKSFVAIVDDWNLDVVKRGTNRAFAALGYRMRLDLVVRERQPMDRIGWWNGLRVVVVEQG